VELCKIIYEGLSFGKPPRLKINLSNVYITKFIDRILMPKE
jgi:hypothetical protein